MPSDDRYPWPMQNMRPAGLPGLLIVLVVVFGFVSLIVSRSTQNTLLWIVISVALLASGLAAWRWITKRGST